MRIKVRLHPQRPNTKRRYKNRVKSVFYGKQNKGRINNVEEHIERTGEIRLSKQLKDTDLKEDEINVDQGRDGFGEGGTCCKLIL